MQESAGGFQGQATLVAGASSGIGQEIACLLGLGSPADVAQAVWFLMGKTARGTTDTTLVVDGGYSAQ